MKLLLNHLQFWKNLATVLALATKQRTVYRRKKQQIMVDLHTISSLNFQQNSTVAAQLEDENGKLVLTFGSKQFLSWKSYQSFCKVGIIYFIENE